MSLTRTLLGLNLLFLMAALAFAGCSDDNAEADEMDEAAPANLSVVLDAEDTITAGLDPGDDVENIKDGWTVRFEKYIVVVGDVDMQFTSDKKIEAEAEDLFAVDLTTVTTAGLPLWSANLQPGQWEFNYQTTGAAHGAKRHESVSEMDFEEMKQNDWTYLVVGKMTKTDGESCPPGALATINGQTATGIKTSFDDDCYPAAEISFRFGVKAETSFGPCEVDEMPGFSIPEGGSVQTVSLTIHGDHMFFNGFPEGDEGGVTRLAQWLADSDLNLDGKVERSELEALKTSNLAAMKDYQLSSPPITINNLWDYVIAQFKTQGHFQGEGECPADGVAHSHGEGEDHNDG